MPDDPTWTREVRLLDSRGVGYLRLQARVLRALPRIDVIIVNGAIGLRSGYRDLVAAVLVRRLRPSTWIVVSDATWETGSRALARLGLPAGLVAGVARVALRALDGPRVVYCVLSQAEVTGFARTWGVDVSRVRFTPFCHTLSEQELSTPPVPELAARVFSGGNSLRDHQTVLAALRELEVDGFLATSAALGPLPARVRAGAVDHDQFVQRMASAHVVVVSLRDDTPRSAGQQTYLNALALGRPLVVSDAKGVRDHVEAGRHALVVPVGDTGALAAAVRSLLDDPDHARRLAHAGREHVLRRHTLLQYSTGLRDVALDAATGRAPRGAVRSGAGDDDGHGSP